MPQIRDFNRKYKTAAGGSARDHVRRGSYGIDRLAPLRTDGHPTPVFALQDGTLHLLHDRYNTAEILGAHGVITEQKELLDYVGGPRHVKQGEIIGHVGLERDGQRKAPHDGARWPGGRGTPAQAQAYVAKLAKARAARERAAARAAAAQWKAARLAEVKRIASFLNGRSQYLGSPKTAASRNGIPGPLYYRLEQKYGRLKGLYDGPVNGINNAATRKVEAHLAELTK
ncbi:MAG: hypothetical protein KGL39_23065 [Patescibacteria group bacterium]|nr:hypothetical protein [Patescibacteria group bacterium]